VYETRDVDLPFELVLTVNSAISYTARNSVVFYVMFNDEVVLMLYYAWFELIYLVG